MERLDESIEVARLWRRQQLSVLECCPKLYHDVRTALDEGRSAVSVLNMIDAALDRTPTPATILSAATTAFDQIRALVTLEERVEFLAIVSAVNRGEVSAIKAKSRLFGLATRHHADVLLEGSYFDDVRDAAEGA